MLLRAPYLAYHGFYGLIALRSLGTIMQPGAVLHPSLQLDTVCRHGVCKPLAQMVSAQQQHLVKAHLHILFPAHLELTLAWL